MAVFTGSAIAFNQTNQILNDGTVDLLTDVLKCDLTTQANAPTASNSSVSELTLFSGGGYPGSITLGTKQILNISGKNWKFTAADIVFTASGGPITDAYYYVVWDDTTTSPVDALLWYGLLDNTPGPVSAADTDSIAIVANATDGFFKFATTT